MRLFIPTLLNLLTLTAAIAADIKVIDLTVDPPKEIIYSDPDARDILSAFNNLPWDNTKGARCHFPAFQIISPSIGTPSLDATICFQCYNVSFSTPREKGMQGFAKATPTTNALHRLLKKTEQGAAANP